MILENMTTAYLLADYYDYLEGQDSGLDCVYDAQYIEDLVKELSNRGIVTF